ncbi:MAG: replication initiation protein [bacterium]
MKINEKSIVKKSNDLIFTSCDLSLIQQKIIAVALSTIYKEDNKLKPFIMPTAEFLTILNITGTNYTYLDKIIKNIADKPITKFVKNNNKEKILRYYWFSITECGNGEVKLNFNTELAADLLNLKQKFTTYSLDNILILKSKYDIKLYEIFKSAIGSKKSYVYTVNIDDFKKLLNIEQIPFYKIKQSILDNVNLSGTDINIEYKLIKQNKKVIKISFKIEKQEKLKILTDNKIIFDYEKKCFIGLKESHLKNYIEMFQIDRAEILNELVKMAEWIFKKTNRLENKNWANDIEKWLEKAADGSNFIK